MPEDRANGHERILAPIGLKSLNKPGTVVSHFAPRLDHVWSAQCQKIQHAKLREKTKLAQRIRRRSMHRPTPGVTLPPFTLDDFLLLLNLPCYEVHGRKLLRPQPETATISCRMGVEPMWSDVHAFRVQMKRVVA
jgi:hypothetical protein